jgi:hypothetical protein
MALTKIQAVILVALIVVPAGAAYWYYQSIIAAPKEIVIAAPLPLSGGMATIGLSCQRGHDLAVEDINATGGMHAFMSDTKRCSRPVYSDTCAPLSSHRYLRLLALWND